jgi:CubicO group peptidase (beta-lactamase class C family)
MKNSNKFARQPVQRGFLRKTTHGIAFVTLSAGLAFNTACAQDSTQKALEQARTELHRAVQDGRIAGAAHLVVRDGKTIYSEAAGLSDIDEKTSFKADSILRIYSMTKPIVSVGAMRLYEQGKFKLDDPVALYIPAFSNATVLQKVGDKAERVVPKRPMSIRDVLRHGTGYSYGDEERAREFYEREGMRYWGPADMFPPKMSIKMAAEALARIPALHHPGERFTYGFSTDLLGRLIEVWSSQPLDVHLQQAVFAPLEMVDTGFSVPKDKRGRFTTCHTLRDGKFAVADKAASSPFNDGFEFLSGGGGLVSTVPDYANFCQMLVDGGQFKGRRLLKEDTVKLMFTDQLNGVAGPFQFGLGFAISEVKLGSGQSQREATQYSWGGYASTDFRIVPGERLIQIFARQQVPSSHDLAGKLFATVWAQDLRRK